METFFRILFGLLLSLVDALVAYWLFPDAVLDLGFWDWFKVSLVVTGMVSSALVIHSLVDD